MQRSVGKAKWYMLHYECELCNRLPCLNTWSATGGDMLRWYEEVRPSWRKWIDWAKDIVSVPPLWFLIDDTIYPITSHSAATALSYSDFHVFPTMIASIPSNRANSIFLPLSCLIFNTLCIYLFCVCTCTGQRTTSRSILSFYCIGPRDQTRVLSLGGRCLYLLSHLISPTNSFYFFFLLIFLLKARSCYAVQGGMELKIFSCLSRPSVGIPGRPHDFQLVSVLKVRAILRWFLRLWEHQAGVGAFRECFLVMSYATYGWGLVGCADVWVFGMRIRDILEAVEATSVVSFIYWPNLAELPCAVWPAWLASLLQGLLVSISCMLVSQAGFQAHPDFYAGSDDPNSGLLACAVSTLLNEPSPQSHFSF